MGLIRSFKYVYDIRRMYKQPSEKIQNFQRERFLLLVSYAKKHSPFYSKLYRNININRNLRIEDLPIVDKETLMNNFDEVITVKDVKKREVLDFIKNEKQLIKLKNKYTVIHSGGTTGNLWVSIFTNDCFDFERACIIESRNLNILGNLFKKVIKLAIMTTENLHVGSTVFYKDFPKFLCDIRHFSVCKPLQEIVEGLNYFMPDVIGAYPLMLKALAEEKAKGNLKIFPRKIFSGSFLLTDEDRNFIATHFGPIPYDIYAATEATGPIAGECELHKRHIYIYSTFLEAIDEDGNTADDNVAGFAVITNLMNYTQPIIRYKLNDIIQISRRKCKCGCNWPVIEKIWGRRGDLVLVKKPTGGYEILDPLLFNFKIEGLEKFQVVQEREDFLRVKIVIKKDDNYVVREIEQQMNKILKEKQLCGIVKVKIEIVPEIETEKGSDKVLNRMIHKSVVSKIHK
ncbi:MAG: hypothetical protein NC822_05140 [Candidatus Omnitrophica bacterium]|nr:hypothetical protein [Candidatus Omnitrophota bacterium]MCM8827295.1 hypothetical protein [Candidatus Omnitrophota bacterium]